MTYTSFTADVVYGDTHPLITNEFIKEIRIVFRAGQSMKAHKTSFPITVMIISGEIDFGIADERMIFGSGDVVAVEPNVLHDLNALEDSILRLSLHKSDSIARVNGVLKL